MSEQLPGQPDTVIQDVEKAHFVAKAEDIDRTYAAEVKARALGNIALLEKTGHGEYLETSAFRDAETKAEVDTAINNVTGGENRAVSVEEVVNAVEADHQRLEDASKRADQAGEQAAEFYDRLQGVKAELK